MSLKRAAAEADAEAVTAKRTCTGAVHNWNPNLAKLEVDYFYHLGIASDGGMKEQFGDVRLVCMHGSPDRALAFGKKVAALFGSRDEVKPIGKTERGILCKVGPVISISHGMGMPSMSIFLHEIVKLLAHAGCLEQCEFVRLGSCGGVGIRPGSIVITREALDGTLTTGWEQITLGEKKRWPSVADDDLMNRIEACGGKDSKMAGEGGPTDDGREIPTIVGNTIGTDDFYEGQGRLDGAFSTWYNDDDKMAYLKRAYDQGVRNIEMEATCFLAFFQRLNRPATVVCAALLNRLQGDQVTTPPEQLHAFLDDSQLLLLRYMKQKFGNTLTLA